MRTARSIWITILVVGIVSALAPVSFAQSTCEELEKELAELKKRVAALEKQQQAALPPAVPQGPFALEGDFVLGGLKQ